jgi:hypothetical protein
MVINGSYREGDMVITTVDDVKMFSTPKGNARETSVLPPQKLHVIARIDYCQLGGIGPRATACGGTWYKVQTWLGDQWIPGPFYLEQVVEEPIDMEVTLTSEEKIYSLPYFANYRQNPNQETIAAGVVKVIAKWGNWYKIDTPQGQLWLLPQSFVLENVIHQEKVIELPTGGNG